MTRDDRKFDRIGLGDPATTLLMANTAGNGFLCKLGDLASKTRQGKDFMTVPEGAKALAPALAAGGKAIAALSEGRPAWERAALTLALGRFAADLDGDSDLFVVGGSEQAGALFLNDGRGHFSEQTAAWGLAPRGAGMASRRGGTGLVGRHGFAPLGYPFIPRPDPRRSSYRLHAGRTVLRR